MSEQQPLVSIAMPARNAERTLSIAVRSILNQSYHNWELLLMEDGSTDRTLNIARSFDDPRIQVRSDGQCRGMTVRLNQAIMSAHGLYYARMDADDVSYPQRLERQIAYLQAHPDVDLVGAWTVVFDDQGKAIGKRAGPERHAEIAARPQAGFPLVHPTFLGHTAWFRQQPYHERTSYSQDYDLLLRRHLYSCYANVPEILLAYREGHINLRKMAVARWEITGSLIRYFGGRGRVLLVARSGLEQALKLSVDVFAVLTGLNYRLLKHRARPITHAEHMEWERVWQGLSSSRN